MIASCKNFVHTHLRLSRGHQLILPNNARKNDLRSSQLGLIVCWTIKCKKQVDWLLGPSATYRLQTEPHPFGKKQCWCKFWLILVLSCIVGKYCLLGANSRELGNMLQKLLNIQTDRSYIFERPAKLINLALLVLDNRKSVLRHLLLENPYLWLQL